MQTSSILLEQKRAELQVKLTILKENLSNLKNQLDSTANLSFINTQYKSGNDLSYAPLTLIACITSFIRCVTPLSSLSISLMRQ